MKEWVAAVKEAMEAQHISVAELAERSGCARGYMYRILSEEHVPTLTKAIAISRQLGMQFEFKNNKRRKRRA